MKIRPIAQKLKTTDYGARAAVFPGEVSGAAQVTLTLSTEDAFGIPSVFGHLKLSPTEARELSARLATAADAAESHTP